ncbi:MAG TPA: hypothetical protein VK517_08000 [Cyclobacteriaceae bacterium]|nr:hypothetical protein [Cyclobacteriaceae bacterium]
MRKKISIDTETGVVTSCRRRCAICFGLSKDTSIKKGQIAHLNKDNSDSRRENLVFLCLEHHDQYDSRTSQSKNFTMAEVAFFRQELERSIAKSWQEPVFFETLPLIDLTDISGHYYWETDNASAELDINALGKNLIQVTGIALSGTEKRYGPNLGQVEFKEKLMDDEIVYADPKTGYEMRIKFGKDELAVSEKIQLGVFGNNVRFEGAFKKAIGPKESHSAFNELLTIVIKEGNLYLRKEDEVLRQLTFTGKDDHPIILDNRKVLFIRYEECIGMSKDEAMGLRTYFRSRIMILDINSLIEDVVADRKPYQDGSAGTFELIQIINPTLSLDGAYLYFVTEKWTTANQLVKIRLDSKMWTELFTAESFELIRGGEYKNLFLVAFSEMRGKGRDIYYKLCDESGKTLKEFDSQETLLEFRKSIV